MQNECIGCSNTDKGGCLNGLKPHLSETEQCPCINCIVKMICENQCEDFVKYLRVVNYPDKRDDKNGK